MPGQHWYNSRPHACLAPSFLGTNALDDLTNARSFDLHITWVIDVLGLFLTCYHGCLYNQALADVRSTCAGFKCLYC